MSDFVVAYPMTVSFGVDFVAVVEKKSYNSAVDTKTREEVGVV